MTRQYASIVNFKESSEYTADIEEFYQLGQDWGKAGNTKLPKVYAWDRGDHVTSVRIVKSSTAIAQAFVKGWKETRPTK